MKKLSLFLLISLGAIGTIGTTGFARDNTDYSETRLQIIDDNIDDDDIDLEIDEAIRDERLADPEGDIDADIDFALSRPRAAKLPSLTGTQIE